jgi:hypothetical protein
MASANVDFVRSIFADREYCAAEQLAEEPG